MSNVMKLLCCVGAVSFFLVVGSTFADYAIPLNDPSFESPQQGLDDENIPTTNWVSNTPGLDAGHGGSYGLNWNAASIDFAGTDDIGGVLQQGVLPDGGQVGLLSNGVHTNGATYNFQLIQQTAHTIVPGETLSLSFYAGNELANKWAGLTASLLDGSGAVIGSQHVVTAPAAGTFSQYTLNATAASGNSGLLTVQFTGDPGSAGLAHACLDMVTLSSTVPEPSTLVLVASGLISLLAYAWRKRK
jgi:hypothetical protein